MKKIMWIISFISLAGTAIVIQFLQEKVPMHFGMDGSIDRWGSKYETLVLPLIIIITSLMIHLLTGYFEKKAQNGVEEKDRESARSNAKVIGIAGVLTAAMFTVMQGYILYTAFNTGKDSLRNVSSDMGKISYISIGVVMIIMGNFMTKTRINSAIGVRVSWSMYNDNTWRKSNHFGAIVSIVTGILIILTSAFLNFTGATIATIGLITLSTIIILIYAHKVYVEEIASQ